MPLKKPSDFFKKEETSLDSIKGEMDVANPEKIERVSEAFTAFRSNLNHIQSLTDFSDTFDGFKDNVDKVDKLSEEIVNVKQDIQNLIKKEELDDAMMAHLYFVEESITKIEKKATTINKEAVSNISKEVSDLSKLVNNFLKVDAPQYKKLVTESETRVDQRFSNFKENVNSRVEDFNEEVSSNIASIAESIEGINEDQLSSIKDEVKVVDSRIDSILEKDLPEYKKFFAETEIRTDKKIKEAKTVFDEKITYVNETYKERIDELNSTVKEFVDKEVPKYSSLLLESKIKSEEDVKTLEKQVIERIQSLTNKINSLSKDVDQKSDDIDTLVDQKISDLHKAISESKEEVSTISNTYDSLYKDFKKREIHESEKLESFENSIDRFSIKINKLESSLTDDICELQENLDTGTSKYYEDFKVEVDEFEKNLSEKLKDLKVDFTVNEKHIDGLRNEFQDVVDRLRLDEIEEKNKELTDKITHIEEVFEKFNEKTVLTEDIPYTQAYAENAKGYIDNPTIPGKPSNNTTDPLTQLDQNFVTLDQLQSHYRIFINRIQTQLATIGGGGAGFIKDLDDVTFDESAGTNKLLIYNGDGWVGIASTALSGGGGETSSTLDDILGNGSETTKGMSVGVITATSGYFSGILTATNLNYDNVTDIYSTGIVTATKGIQITTLGLNIASGIATLTDGLRVGSAATISANGNATFSGIVTATSFTGDGTGLTGVASTDNIQTATPATFLSNVNITGVTTASGGFKGDLVGDVTGDVTGNADTATTATTATNVTVADESSDTSCNVLFTTAATGNLPPKSGTNLTFNSANGTLTATTFSGAVTGDVTGNADTATALETSRNIGGVSFNGTGDITLPGVNASGNQNTSGTSAGLTGSPSVELTNVVGAAASIAGIVTATTFKGALTGNVTGNTSGSSGSCTGNAATATILETARDIGGVSFNGSASINLPGVNQAGNQNTSGTAAGLTGSPSVELTNIVGAAASIVGVSTFSGNIKLPDNVAAKFGTGEDGSIKHTGTNLQIFETTGNIQITNYANDKDVIINSDDGSGGTANYFVADGSTGEAILYNYGSEKIKTTSTGASVTGDLTLTDTTADSAAGPELLLYRNSSSPADADYLGQIKFQGENDNDEQINYAKITGKISDASDSSEDGILEFAHIKAGSQTITGRWKSTELQLLNDTDFSVAGDSTFTGSIDVDGGADISGGSGLVASTAKVSDLTSGRVVIAGTSGELEDASTLTFSGGTLSATTFSGSGASLTTLNGSNISSGTVAAARVATLNQDTTGTAAGITEADTSVSSTSATTVLSFAHASYRGAFINLSITQGSNYQIGRYSIIHDGTTVTVTEEFSVATGSMLGTFSGTISSSNLLFQVTMGSSDSSTITVKADKITV